MLGFPLSSDTLVKTIDQVQRVLGRGAFLARYVGEDGVSGGEGAFLVCSSWLVDAQLASGRTEEAQALIDRLVGCANDVGLYAEELDDESGRFLGNFPQALTHLGVIGNIVNLQLARAAWRRGTARVVCRPRPSRRDCDFRLARFSGGHDAITAHRSDFLVQAIEARLAVASA